MLIIRFSNNNYSRISEIHSVHSLYRLFLNRSGEPLDSTGTKLMIRRLGKKARVHGVHVHRLRHTFAISFLRAGGDVFSLQYLLGHTTLQMTQRYLQSLNADDAMNAHRKFSPLDNMNLTRRLRSSQSYTQATS